jgi:hypothetical protein
VKRTTFAPVTSMRYTLDGLQVMVLGHTDSSAVKQKKVTPPPRRKSKR